MLQFGNEETIECIQPVALKGAKGEALCLAHKHSILFIGGGVYLKDEGYVLRPVDDAKLYYPMPEGEELARLQAHGVIPAPLPPYRFDAFDYFIGYSLWFGIAVAFGLSWFKRVRSRQRQASWSNEPVSLGPPSLEKAGDQYIDAQVRPLLRAGETVQHQAFGTTRRPDGGMIATIGNQAFFAVLTSQRLLLIKTRVGAFGLLLENHGVEELERAQIARAAEDDWLITFHLAGGGARTLHVPMAHKGKLSNQRAFARDVPRILSPAAAADGFAAVPAPIA